MSVFEFSIDNPEETVQNISYEASHRGEVQVLSENKTEISDVYYSSVAHERWLVALV